MRAREKGARGEHRVLPMAIERQIYLYVLRALEADRRNATRLERLKFLQHFYTHVNNIQRY